MDWLEGFEFEGVGAVVGCLAIVALVVICVLAVIVCAVVFAGLDIMSYFA